MPEVVNSSTGRQASTFQQWFPRAVVQLMDANWRPGLRAKDPPELLLLGSSLSRLLVIFAPIDCQSHRRGWVDHDKRAWQDSNLRHTAPETVCARLRFQRKPISTQFLSHHLRTIS